METSRDSFLVSQTTWILANLGFAGLVIVNSNQSILLLETVFLIWFVGFAIVVELLAPPHRSPDRWQWLKWVWLSGLILAVLIVVHRAYLLL